MFGEEVFDEVVFDEVVFDGPSPPAYQSACRAVHPRNLTNFPVDTRGGGGRVAAKMAVKRRRVAVFREFREASAGLRARGELVRAGALGGLDETDEEALARFQTSLAPIDVVGVTSRAAEVLDTRS